MIGSLQENWKHTWKAIWLRLDESTKSPDDLFACLYRAAKPYLANPPDAPQDIEVLNDRETARTFFRQLQSSDYNGEQAIIAFLEDTYQALASLSDSFSGFFKRKVCEFLETYNLPYRVCDDFEIRLTLVGPLASLYNELRVLNESDAHLAGLLDDFEQLFHRYCRDRQELDLRNCIGAFSKYQEALIRRTLADPASRIKFRTLTKRLSTWPHGGVKAAVNNLYGFCSDYPGMRHGGNPAGQLRQLKDIDAVALGAFFLGFCGYLTEDIRVTELIEA